MSRSLLVLASLLLVSSAAALPRPERSPAVSSPEEIVPGTEGPSLALQEELLYERLKAMSGAPAGLRDAFEAFASALADGTVDDRAIASTAAMAADPDAAAKIDVVLRDFAQAVLAGRPPIAPTELPEAVRPVGWRPVAIETSMPKALCNSCTAGQRIAAPTPACQLVSGQTTTTCPEDFYRVALTAGSTVRFALCPSTCPGATASYDTRLRVLDSTCRVLAENDDSCGLQSSVTFTPTASGDFTVDVTGFRLSDVGPYTLGYLLPPANPCSSCSAPRRTITPTTSCQSVTGDTSDCGNSSTATTMSGGDWLNVNLTAGRTYTFSTCPSDACGGSAAFDTRLDLWNSACTTLLASNDDASGCSLIFRSSLQYTAPTTGVCKLQVRGFSTDVGSYTLAYRQVPPCTAPTIASTGPSSGVTSPTSCSTAQPFTVTAGPGSEPPFTGTWTITPPPGGSASPSSGSIAFTGFTGTFASSLTRPACGGPQAFTISATIASCGLPSAPSTWTYTLRDATPPAVTGCPPGVGLDCATPDPPPPALGATDACDPAPTVTFAQVHVNGSCPGNWTTRRTWTARDCSNNVGRCIQNVVHSDTQAPVVTAPDTFCVSPPDHDLACVFAADLVPTITEDCSPPITRLFTGCVSSDPDSGTGAGDLPNDCEISPDGKQACVRSELSGPQDRVYALVGIAIDRCGNESAPATLAAITIPHDGAPHPECRIPESGPNPPW